jgi:glycosyltransferase involved in cell wall biosynthesis
LPIGYWRYGRKLLEEEAQVCPEWAATLVGNKDSEQKLIRKDDEIDHADAIYVASTFTKHTLSSAPVKSKPIFVIPYGAPPCASHSLAGRSECRPLRAIFVGSLSQRKGIGYLSDAIDALGQSVKLTLVGLQPTKACSALDRMVKRHRYIPSLPHSEILKEMRRHDVLIFPSLFEGFGLVLLEAMAQGLPVITTANTAGPDLITDGVEGFLVPIRSSQAIAEKLDLLQHQPMLVREMGARALVKAQEMSWRSYSAKFISTLGGI